MQTIGSKQPWEAFRQPFDFEGFLGADETINSIYEVVVESLDSDGAVDEDVSSTMADVTKNTISSDAYTANIWIQGGTDGILYKITCRIIGTLGSQYELECILPVKEV